MQATAPMEDWVDAGPALDDEAPGKAGFVIETELVTGLTTELATELATVEEDAFIDKVVDAD